MPNTVFEKQEESITAVKSLNPEQQKETPTTRLLAKRKQEKEQPKGDKLKIGAKAPNVKRSELASYLRGIARTIDESHAERFNIDFSITEAEA